VSARDSDVPGTIGAGIYHMHPHSFEIVHGLDIEVEKIIHLVANENRWVFAGEIDYRDSDGYHAAYMTQTGYRYYSGTRTPEYSLSPEGEAHLFTLTQMLFTQIAEAEKDKIEKLLVGK